MNKKAVTTLKTDAFQYIGDKIPDKITISLQLISMRILTAANNPKEFNYSRCLGTTLCARLPEIMSKAPLSQLVNANTNRIKKKPFRI